MNFHLELFDRAVLVNPFLLCFNALLVVHFFIDWYFQKKKSGMPMSLWQIFIVRHFLLQFLVLYPFYFAEINRDTIGYHYNFVIPSMDWAYIVTVTGYCALYLGRWVADVQGLGSRFRFNVFEPLELLIKENIRSKVFLNTFLSICLAMGMFVLLTSVANGKFMAARDYFLSNPPIRPFYNLTLGLFPIATLFIGLVVVQSGEQLYKYLFVIFFLISITLGTRSAALEPLFILFLFYIYKNPHHFNLRTISLISIAMLGLMLFIGQFRTSSDRTILETVAYGNTFSDTRDFAWVLTKWDKEFLNGNSFLAGLISFIPRSLSEFRDQWSYGLFTSHTIGSFDPKFPGLRTGYFGEPYFNFGYVGVMIFGFISGLVVRYTEKKIEKDYRDNRDLFRSYAFMLPVNFLLCFSMSANFPFFYGFIIIMIMMGFIRQLLGLLDVSTNDLKS